MGRAGAIQAAVAVGHYRALWGTMGQYGPWDGDTTWPWGTMGHYGAMGCGYGDMGHYGALWALCDTAPPAGTQWWGSMGRAGAIQAAVAVGHYGAL